MFNSHNLSLKLIQHCPSCNTAFQQAQISIIQETDFTILAHMQCAHCHMNMLANVVTMPQGLVGNAILTDLHLEEVQKLLEAGEMNEDYFLNMFSFVRQRDLWKSLHTAHSADARNNMITK